MDKGNADYWLEQARDLNCLSPAFQQTDGEMEWISSIQQEGAEEDEYLTGTKTLNII